MASQSQILSRSTNIDGSSCQASLSSPAINRDWDTVPQTIRSSWAPSDRPDRRTGWFWAHGHDVQRKTEDGQSYQTYFLCCHCIAQQVYCPKSYVSSNTRNIENHLRKAHDVLHPNPSSKTMRPLPKRALDQPDLRSFLAKKQKTDDVQKESVTRIESIDKPTFQRRLVQWATTTNQPFDILEHSELSGVFKCLNPLREEGLLTHDNLRNTILEEVNSLKARVIEALERSPSCVHISFEGWTSEDRQTFFSVNASFLDAETFQPRKVMLGIPDLITFGTGEDFSGAVTNVLKEYKLISQYNNKVGYFVLNDAPDSDRVVEELGRTLQWQNPSQRRVRCFGHDLRHIAHTMLFADKSDAVNNLDPYDFHEWARRGPVGKLHNLVVWISRSNKAKSILESLQVQDPHKKHTGTLDVLLEDKTSWVSQYPMIDRAMTLRPYLKELMEIVIQASTRSRSKSTAQRKQQSPLPLCLTDENLLTDADWNALGWFKDILHLLDVCRLKLEQRQFPPQSPDEEISENRFDNIWQVVRAYKFICGPLEKARTEAVDRPEPSYYASYINAACTEANKYYAKIDETPLFYAATVLHPYYQWRFLGRVHAAKEDRLAEARRLVKTLWEEEYRDFPGLLPKKEQEDPIDEWWNGCPYSYRDDYGWDETNRKVVLSDELERWWSSMEGMKLDVDPFDYWVELQFDYPRVAKMALDILSIPAIPTECERSIPSGGLASLNQAQLDTSTNAISRAVKSWVKAGLLDGYDGLLKEL
ncbi:uncharacterized protein CPUR_03263 [Claviceps purpurea 20.1]|uniref:HAT C-terminal dimerisation domain-containing protein n=1 Tax=Claviceps purpurea (strain 20.1) TaxID=1111077 RepID=M1WIW8_CLAP2|nr:uncharacterized protein CPUR_03263 [Claviceps purpurea 20.1]